MKYSTKSGSINELKAPCVVCSLADAKRVAKAQGETQTLNTALVDFKDSVGQTLVVALRGAVDRVLVVGGVGGSIDDNAFRKASRAAAERLVTQPVNSAVWNLHNVKVKGQTPYWRATISLQDVSLASYRFASYHSKEQSPLSIKRLALLADARSKSATSRAVREAQALKSGLDFARDLGNEPPNVCDPNYLLKEARKLSKADGVKVSSLDEKKMIELGMGAFMAVSQGSDKPGRMIIIEYSGGKRGEQPVALVGKGITFDTGGISLKPGPAMDEMKFDMCGAAAVLGATKAAIEAKLPLNLVTIVAAAENMPSGRATRPGDIVTTSSGQTVEILNTDAEGRLVLCDALTYVHRFKPKAVIDVATLTGACIIALGAHASGLMGNDESLAQDILAAGQWSGDRSWQLPLWDDYQVQLKSNFADMANIGGRGAGSVTAGCFLARFTKELRWAHMDVAGTAFLSGPRKGSSGRPVPSLFRYLVNECKPNSE